jgi:hypothetical protein
VLGGKIQQEAVIEEYQWSGCYARSSMNPIKISSKHPELHSPNREGNILFPLK